MIQTTDSRIARKGTSAVVGHAGKIKTPIRSPAKTKTPSSHAVHYASLPEHFKVMSRASSLLLAQSKKQTKCKISTSTKTKKARVRVKSRGKLGTYRYRYSFRIKTGNSIVVNALNNKVTQFPLKGVEVTLHGYRKNVPLNARVEWDAKAQKIRINGRILKSSKITGSGYNRSLSFDHAELGKLAKPQFDTVTHRTFNALNRKKLEKEDRALPKIDAGLKALYKRYKKKFRRFKKDRIVRIAYKGLKKQYDSLRSYLRALHKQAKKLKKWKAKRKTFTPAFRTKLKTYERELKSLRTFVKKVRSKIGKILYRYWYRHYRQKKKKC